MDDLTPLRRPIDGELNGARTAASARQATNGGALTPELAEAQGVQRPNETFKSLAEAALGLVQRRTKQPIS